MALPAFITALILDITTRYYPIRYCLCFLAIFRQLKVRKTQKLLIGELYVNAFLIQNSD